MTDKIGIDASELNTLAADLSKAGMKANAAAAGVIKKGALNIKNGAQELAPKGPSLPYYSRTITFDLTVRGTTITAEIGPDKDLPQGPLGNILEFGTSRAAPQPHLLPALQKESPAVERFLGVEVSKTLKEAL